MDLMMESPQTVALPVSGNKLPKSVEKTVTVEGGKTAAVNFFNKVKR